MNKCRCDQDSSSKVLGAKEEGGWNAEAWKLSHKDREGATGAGHKQDNEETSDVKGKVVVRLIPTRFAGTSSRWAMDG